jgi:hypothetical protein
VPKRKNVEPRNERQRAKAFRVGIARAIIDDAAEQMAKVGTISVEKAKELIMKCARLIDGRDDD